MNDFISLDEFKRQQQIANKTSVTLTNPQERVRNFDVSVIPEVFYLGNSPGHKEKQYGSIINTGRRNLKIKQVIEKGGLLISLVPDTVLLPQENISFSIEGTSSSVVTGYVAIEFIIDTDDVNFNHISRWMFIPAMPYRLVEYNVEPPQEGFDVKMYLLEHDGQRINHSFRVDGQVHESTVSIHANQFVEAGPASINHGSGNYEYRASQVTIFTAKHIHNFAIEAEAEGLIIQKLNQEYVDQLGIIVEENTNVFYVSQMGGVIEPKEVTLTATSSNETFKFNLKVIIHSIHYVRLHDTQPTMSEKTYENILSFPPYLELSSIINGINNGRRDDLSDILSEQDYIQDKYEYGLGGSATWVDNKIQNLMSKDLKESYPLTMEKTVGFGITYEPFASFFAQFESELPLSTDRAFNAVGAKEFWCTYGGNQLNELDRVSNAIVNSKLINIPPKNNVRIFDNILYRISDNNNNTGFLANIRYARNNPLQWACIIPKIIRIKHWSAGWWHDGTPIFGADER